MFAIFVLFLYTYPYHTTWMDPLTHTMVAQVVLPLWWILRFTTIPSRFHTIPSQQRTSRTHPVIPAITLAFIALIATGSSSYFRLQSPAFSGYSHIANIHFSWGILSPPAYVVIDMVSQEQPLKRVFLWRQLHSLFDYGGHLIFPGKTGVFSMMTNPTFCSPGAITTCKKQEGLFKVRARLYYANQYGYRNIKDPQKQRFLEKKTGDVLVREYEGPTIPFPPGTVY